MLTSVYSDNQKKGNIVPVHKKEMKNLVKNYRPISLLPVCCKIFEKHFYNSLFENVKVNNLLVKSQSGFISGDACISLLLCSPREIYKSFDCSPSLETRGVSLDISQLHNCKQRVALNSRTSKWANINAGVTQVSALGTLLFLIYINELPEGLQSNVKHSADDTSVISVVNDTNVFCRELNDDLL